MNLKKRIPIYLAGVSVMALGITFLNKSDLGTTPLSSIPYVLSKILAGNSFLTFGILTLMFHTLCIVFQVILWKKLTLQMFLQFPLAIAFSALLDVFMGWVQVPDPGLWLRAILCALGVTLSALGIVTIVSMDLMLPSPDALLRAVSARTGIELYKVKITGDVTWVTLTAILSLAFLYTNGMRGLGSLLAATFTGELAVGVGTLFAMYFTGRLVGVFKQRLKFMEMGQAKAGGGRPAYPPHRGTRQESDEDLLVRDAGTSCE